MRCSNEVSASKMYLLCPLHLHYRPMLHHLQQYAPTEKFNTSCHIGHWPKLLSLANTGDMGTRDLLHLMNWHGRGHVYPTLHSGIPEVIQLSWSLVNSHHKGYELWRPKPSYRPWGKSLESGRKYAT